MPLTTTKGKQKKPRRIMLYGVYGIGKSTFAAGAPDAVFLPTEDGIANIDCESFPLSKTYEQFMGYLSELCTEDHDRKTIVVDTLDWLEQLLWRDVERKQCVTSIEDIGYARGYTFACKQWRQILNALDYLRDHKGMDCLLLAHAKIERFSPPDNDPFDRYSPKLHKLAAGIMQEWCDEVLYANYRVFTKTEGEGFTKRTQGVGTGERIIHTSERPSHLAKNRANLPETLPLSWQEYADAISF